MKHNIKSTTNAAMGGALKIIATEIYQIDGNYKMWYNGKIIMILSQTKLANFFLQGTKMILFLQ